MILALGAGGIRGERRLVVAGQRVVVVGRFLKRVMDAADMLRGGLDIALDMDGGWVERRARLRRVLGVG